MQSENQGHLIMGQKAKLRCPQGLKPASLAVLSGTTEGVPFQNRFMETALSEGDR